MSNDKLINRMPNEPNRETEIEIGAIASIISENMFEQVHMSTPINEGVIGAHYKIGMLAMVFQTMHKDVVDWEAESDRQGCSDWEECILKFVTSKLNKEAKNG